MSIKCDTCKDTGYITCLCQLDGFMEEGCDGCNDEGYVNCPDCNILFIIASRMEYKDKRIAELEADVARLKVDNFKLESIVQETSIIDEETGNVYMDGEQRTDLIAILTAKVVLSDVGSEPTTADDFNTEFRHNIQT